MSESDGQDPVPGYKEPDFWDKVGQFALAAGGKVIYVALQLYYAAQSDEVPLKAKLTIYGALAYFILPFDAIPDALPMVGYLDDLGALMAAFGLVAMHITESVKAQAREKFKDFFGRYPGEEDEPRMSQGG